MARKANGGFDDPLAKDPLFWFVVVLSTSLVVAGMIRAADVWYVWLLQWATSYFWGGILVGSVREFVRGLREVVVDQAAGPSPDS